MEDYKKLCELIHREIDKEVAKNSLTPDSVRTIGYAVDVLKDIKTIEAMEDEYGGYSGHYPERGWQVRPFYSYNDMPDNSYARMRDSMGRYSRDDMPDGSYRGYSRNNKIENLERMMNEAKDPEEREMYRKLIVKAENEQR